MCVQDSHEDKPTFQDVVLGFKIINSGATADNSNVCEISGGSIVKSDSIDITEVISQPDFSVDIQYNVYNDQLSYNINGSLDLFDLSTIDHIGQRFLILLQQLFQSNVFRGREPLYNVSLLLPEEYEANNELNNTQVLFPPVECVHHKFFTTAMHQSQKVAIELDEQCLTYNEFLYYAQYISILLLQLFDIQAGEIICQCVERSISMVSLFIRVKIAFVTIIESCF